MELAMINTNRRSGFGHRFSTSGILPWPWQGQFGRAARAIRRTRESHRWIFRCGGFRQRFQL